MNELNVMDRFDLTGRTALVTGAARGLGKAMAAAMAEAGADIVIADRDLETAEEAAGEIRKKGAEVLVTETDVTVPEDCRSAVVETLERFGEIEILVNNAGIANEAAAEEMPYEVWQKMIDVNLTGVFLMAQAVGRQMIDGRGGSIINIASMSGMIVNRPQKQAHYNASKAGVIMLTKSLAAEWADDDIRVNAIAPGYMQTEMTKNFFEERPALTEEWMDLTPMNRPGRPHELGPLAVYLAAPASSFVTGSVFVIDGGYTVW